ncbi:MAG: dimethyl sulfoxide reductase anchor subunit, partial [Hyphomicrobiaceae bacterium]|nr:dimethyl sulfoxide reductase anchor subunit [Hyphomicrobiaceae bacterium]
HGFFFTADNCIGCHACEAACSEKNDTPSHIAFRSVGFVESGSYPDYARLNISMACNHCDDPVCLKGCPTRAYTKFAEYGAVLQDPDICFGCGYCAWVCPYNAPQLDPVKGEVSKCNMCVDRLEVGLKPACVSACLGNALDFGVIENVPEGREQASTQIPGFPTPEITHPNIRFQLSRTLQRIFTRPDSAPVKYVRGGDEGFISAPDESKLDGPRQWNLKALLTSHENAHIVFTLSTQAVIGAFLIMIYGSWFGAEPSNPIGNAEIFWPFMIAMLSLLSFGLFTLNMHLGKPMRFYRGFNNWRLSPVSREIAGVTLFFMGLGAYAFAGLLGPDLLHVINVENARRLADLATIPTLIGAVVGLYYMIKLYLIPARPFWNHWQTASSFIGSGLALGTLLIGAAAIAGLGLRALQNAAIPLAMLALIGLAIEALGLFFHARTMKRQGGEGAASHFEQTSRYGKAYLTRNILLVVNMGGLAAIALLGLPAGGIGVLLALTLSVSILTSAIIGRALFYVLVIPTTMPGSFFWRNKGFEQHAKDSGLAARIKAGVLAKGH